RTIEARLVDKEGETRFFEMHRRLHFDAEGQFKGGEGIARDVTESRRLQESLRLHQAIIAASDDAVAIFDCDGSFIENNPAHERLLGYSVEELRAANTPLWCGPEAAARISTALRDSGSFRGEVDSCTKDGRTLHIDLSVFPVTAEDGTTQCFVGFARDVTERKREERRRQVFQQLREQVLLMHGEADLDGVLKALEEGLHELGIDYQNCGINLLDTSTDPPTMRSRSTAPGGGWMESATPRAVTSVHDMWKRGEATYRPDLQADDPFDELPYIQTIASIRAVVDVPFSHGTLALSSTTANAFSESDLLLLQEIAGVLSSGFQRIDDLRRLALSEERYRTLLETPDFIVMLIDPAGNYIYVTPRVREWLDVDPEDFYADPKIGERLIHEEDVAAVTTAFERGVAGQNVEGVEYRWRHGNGEYRWASGGVYPIRGEDGGVHTVQVVIHDISRLKALIEESERTNRELLETQTLLVRSEKMAALGNLVAGIAHEINTPVGAIHSMHDTLVRAVEKLKTTMEEQYPECCTEGSPLARALKVIEDSNRVIETGSARVTTIVRSLRNFARLDEVERKAANLHEGLDDSLMLIHHDIKGRVEIERDYGEIPAVLCYPGRLNQVFLNILNNSQQAIEGTGTITVRTRQVGEEVHVAITDTGSGIEKELLTRIFDPGYTTKGVGVGTGLGLSICFQIMEDHEGRIDVTSEVGVGSTFTIVIPIAPDQ
ncbi:MAG: PAS domain S-box protein, partial [Candidatus Latescibacteria bacterium]|nr:PAS domain S-box protein [Candidatus Latescibacterota bacterium]